MFSSGQLLQNQRLKKNLSLEEVEKKIKIRQKYLKAIEMCDFSKFPGETFVMGFVKNYSEFLGLPADQVLALVRREYSLSKEKELLPSGFSKPLVKNKGLFPKISIPFAFILGIFLLFFYLYLQYQSFYKTPTLIIISPSQNKEIVTKDTFLLKGKTDQEAKILINGQEVLLNEEGIFEIMVKLKTGENEFVFKSVSPAGRENLQKKIIIRKK